MSREFDNSLTRAVRAAITEGLTLSDLYAYAYDCWQSQLDEMKLRALHDYRKVKSGF